MMFAAAARFGPPLPRPRPVGAGVGLTSLLFINDCDASFHLGLVSTERGRGPLIKEFSICIDNFECLFICPEIKF